MNLEKFNLVKVLFSLKDTVRNHHKKFKQVVAEDSRIDKYNYTFKVGSSDRFNGCQFKFYLDAYKGYYGSSSCSTSSMGDSKIINEALVNYINKNKDSFLQGIAEEIEIMATHKLSEAESEVNKVKEEYESLQEALNLSK